jgi:DNA-binding NtrC family response regulator
MNKTVLIIDDEQDILDILDKFFKRKNKFNVVKSTNPIMALEEIKQGGIDLVLSDIMMPQMDGVELLKQIKSFNPDIKVIMMTAFSTLDRTLECEKLGADDYVTKPFISLRDVENKVLDVLGL